MSKNSQYTQKFFKEAGRMGGKISQTPKCEHDRMLYNNMIAAGYPACYSCPKCKKNLHCKTCIENWKNKGLMKWKSKEKKCLFN